VKSWIRTCNKFKIQELYNVKTELWRAVDARNKVSKWSLGVNTSRPMVEDSHHFEMEKDSDPHYKFSKKLDLAPDPH
jgi:hypothetical protein